VSEVIYQGRLAGSFYGFDGEMLFQLANGSYWIQAKYKYWYKYKYRPHAVITKVGGQFILTVEGKSIPVRPISVLESKIDGEFNGWEGESTYQLTNGQVWQQSRYKYQYKYAYRPDVLIYPSSDGYTMKVADTEAVVRRIR
jgi:hypothetical protein